MNYIKTIKILFLILINLAILSGCSDKKDTSSNSIVTEADYYECTINKDFSDITPLNINSVYGTDNIVLDGYLKEINSDISLISSDKHNSNSLSCHFSGKQVADFMYSDKNEGIAYIIFTDSSEKCSFVEYDINNNTEKVLFTSDYYTNMKLSLGSDGCILAPVYSVDENTVKLDSLKKYSSETGITEDIDYSSAPEFSNSDLMLYEFQTLNTGEYICLFYNEKTESVYFIIYDINFEKISSVECNDLENYMDYCFSNDNKLLIFYDADDIIDIESYDIESGLLLNHTSLRHSYVEKVFDGVGEYKYFFQTDNSVFGVSESFEETELLNSDNTVSKIFIQDNNLFYMCFINNDTTNISFLLNNNFEILHKNKINSSGINLYTASLYNNSNDSAYIIFRDDNLNFNYTNIEDTEYKSINQLSDPASLIDYITLDNNIMYRVLSDIYDNRKIVITDLENTKNEKYYELGSLPSDTEFWYKDNCIYYITDNNTENTKVFKFDFATQKSNIFCELNDSSVHFTCSFGQYDLCLYSDDYVYAFSNDEEKILLNIKDTQYIPDIYEVFVNNDSSINIIGVDSDYKMNMYHFIKTDTAPEKNNTITVWTNMSFEDIYPEFPQYRIKSLIDKNNTSENNYLIEVESFDFSDLYTKLLTDDTPDVILSSGHLDSSYADYVTDLSDFIAKEINNKDYYENVAYLGKKNNKIYEIIPEFICESFICEKSNSNTEGLWNIDDLLSNINSTKCKKIFYEDERNKIELFNYLIFDNLYSFIDPETNIVSLNNDKTIQLLELIKKYGKDDNLGEQDDIKQCLLKKTTITPLGINNYMKNGEYNHPVFTGIASAEDASICISPLFSVAVMKSSDKQTYAADFLKMLISEDFLNASNSQTIRRSSIKAAAKREGLNYNNVKNLGLLFDGPLVLKFDNSSLTDSLSESIYEYFNNDISAEKLLNIIENKVSLYLNETK